MAHHYERGTQSANPPHICSARLHCYPVAPHELRELYAKRHTAREVANDTYIAQHFSTSQQTPNISTKKKGRGDIGTSRINLTYLALTDSLRYFFCATISVNDCRINTIRVARFTIISRRIFRTTARIEHCQFAGAKTRKRYAERNSYTVRKFSAKWIKRCVVSIWAIPKMQPQDRNDSSYSSNSQARSTKRSQGLASPCFFLSFFYIPIKVTACQIMCFARFVVFITCF